MEKTKKKTIVQSGVCKGSPMEGVGLWREKFKEKVFFEFIEWNRVGVMNSDSGDDGTDELREFD